MTRITLARDFPPDLIPSVTHLLARYQHLLPTWCHDLTVRYKRNEKLSGLIKVEPEYRRACLFISGAFVREDAIDRENTIAHELLHVALWPLYKRAEALAEMLCEGDEAGKKDLLAQLVELNEAAVCDLTRSVTEGAGKA